MSHPKKKISLCLIGGKENVGNSSKALYHLNQG